MGVRKTREIEFIDLEEEWSQDERGRSPGRAKSRESVRGQVKTDLLPEERPVRKKRVLTKEERRSRKRKRRRARILRGMVLILILGAAACLLLFVVRLTGSSYGKRSAGREIQTIAGQRLESTVKADNRKWKDFYAAPLETPELAVQLLTVNDYSRPGELLPEVKNIFIHYTANAGTTAEQNRSYFESLSETHERSASAHFVIGYDGEIVQCIPTKEIAYAVMKRNYDSISIECCYLDKNGAFTKATYDSLIQLTAWLLHKYELTPEDVLRHYDEGGKNCPKYYVENEPEWKRFLQDLTIYMEGKK